MFTAEVEFLLSQLPGTGESIKILQTCPIEINSSSEIQNSLKTQEALRNIINQALKTNKKNQTGNLKIIVLLAFDEKVISTARVHYEEASVLSTMVKNSEDDLGAVCIELTNDQQLIAHTIVPNNVRAQKFFSDVFSQLKIRSTPVQVTYDSETNNKTLSHEKTGAHAELVDQVRYFAEHGSLKSQMDIPNLQSDLQLFYSTRTFRDTLKSNAAFFTQNLIGFLIFQSARFAEAYFVMSLDEQSLAASALAIGAMRISVLFGTRPLEAITLLVSVASSAKNVEEQAALTRAGWLFSLFSAAVISFFLWTSEYWFTHILGQSPELSKIAGDFLKIYCGATIPVTISVACNNLLFGRNEPGAPALIELGTAVIGTLLTWALVYGKLGASPLGLSGFGISLVIQKFMNLAMIGSYFCATRKQREYTLMKRDSLKDICSKASMIARVGSPFAMQIGSEVIYLFILILYAGLLGNTKLGQANIIFEYFTCFGMAAALVMQRTAMQKTGEVVGRDLMLRKNNSNHARDNLIQENLRTIKQIVKANVMIGTVCATLIAAIFISCNKGLVDLYMKSEPLANAESIRQGMANLFYIMAASVFPDQARNLVGGIINGLGDVSSPAWSSSIFTVLVGGGLAYALTFPATLGLQGTLGTSCMAYGLGAFTLAFVARSLYKRLYNNTEKLPANCWTVFCNRRSKKAERTTLEVVGVVAGDVNDARTPLVAGVQT